MYEMTSTQRELIAPGCGRSSGSINDKLIIDCAFSTS